MTPIEKAVKHFGSQAELARAIQKSPAFVHQMVTGGRPVPAEIARIIDEESGGAVSKHDLCPKAFGSRPRLGESAA